MSSLNKKPEQSLTLEGGKAGHCSDEQALRRAVLSTLLWEKQFFTLSLLDTKSGTFLGSVSDLPPAVVLTKASSTS